jgi:hypothetical protein
MPIERVDEWPRLLNALVEQFRTVPFIWGIHDCGTFSMACVAAITGRAPNDTAVPRNTLQGYLRLIAAQPDGILGLARPIFGPFGTEMDGWQNARRGDVVIINSPRVQQVGVPEAMGVCMGGTVACVGANGLEFVSLMDITKVFRIGL